MSKERREALASLGILFLLLGCLVAYQRFLLPRLTPERAQEAGETKSAERGKAGPAVGGAAEMEEQRPGAATPPSQTAEPIRFSPPLDGQHKVLQPYGFAYSAIYDDFRLYPGVEYAASPGDPVRAVAAGVVARIEDDPQEGRVVVIDHANGISSRYVGVGAVQATLNLPVQAGSIIAQIGKPGAADTLRGAHLRLEIRENGNPIDPTPLLNQH